MAFSPSFHGISRPGIAQSSQTLILLLRLPVRVKVLLEALPALEVAGVHLAAGVLAPLRQRQAQARLEHERLRKETRQGTVRVMGILRHRSTETNGQSVSV